MKNIVFTLCSNNYLAHAKTLGDSVLAVDPSVSFVIGLVDRRDPSIDYGFFSNFEIVDCESIGFPVFEEMIKRYNVIEFNTAVKPFYLEYLLKRCGSGAKVYYVDPDIVWFGSFDRLNSILKNQSIVLTPMLTVPSASVTTDELVALRHGMYNLGFIGTAYSDETFRFLEWWKERLKAHCVIDKRRGLFVDQKWVDIATLFFQDINVLRDVGYNMAWWNLAERTLMKSGSSYFVNNKDCELIFFHFSGYKVGSDYFTGRMNNPKYLLTSRPDLIEIFRDYSQRLISNRYTQLSKLKPLLPFVPLASGSKTLTSRAKAKVKGLMKKIVK